MENKKLTKKEALMQIKDLVKENKELTIFVNHELELLEKRQNTSSKIQQARQEEREKLGAAILELLGDSETALSATAIGVAVGISTQKTVPILNGLALSGKITKTIEKRKALYTLADIV